MKDIDILNTFFVKTDLSDTEIITKNKCIALKQKIDSLSEEIKSRRTELIQKEGEISQASSQLDVLLQLIVEQEKVRTSPVPAVEPSAAQG